MHGYPTPGAIGRSPRRGGERVFIVVRCASGCPDPRATGCVRPEGRAAGGQETARGKATSRRCVPPDRTKKREKRVWTLRGPHRAPSPMRDGARCVPDWVTGERWEVPEVWRFPRFASVKQGGCLQSKLLAVQSGNQTARSRMEDRRTAGVPLGAGGGSLCSHRCAQGACLGSRLLAFQSDDRGQRGVCLGKAVPTPKSVPAWRVPGVMAVSSMLISTFRGRCPPKGTILPREPVRPLGVCLLEGGGHFPGLSSSTHCFSPRDWFTVRADQGRQW